MAKIPSDFRNVILGLPVLLLVVGGLAVVAKPNVQVKGAQVYPTPQPTVEIQQEGIDGYVAPQTQTAAPQAAPKSTPQNIQTSTPQTQSNLVDCYVAVTNKTYHVTQQECDNYHDTSGASNYQLISCNVTMCNGSTQTYQTTSNMCSQMQNEEASTCSNIKSAQGIAQQVNSQNPAITTNPYPTNEASHLGAEPTMSSTNKQLYGY